MNIYNLKTFDFEGYDNNIHIMIDKSRDEFETILKELAVESNKDEELISNVVHYENIICLLEERYNVKIVYVYDDEYILEDRQPISNSVRWEVKRTEIKEL